MIKYQHFMVNAVMEKKDYKKSDLSEHEHCTMCGTKFSERTKDLHLGYVTKDGIHWVCSECFEYYKQEYGWSCVE